MENATKALIIAAAVLIAIALIALGIRILSSTKGTTEQVDRVATELEISIYNSQFTKFEGTQRGSNVKQLVRSAKMNNAKINYNTIYIELHDNVKDYSAIASEPSQIESLMVNEIDANGVYTVTVGVYNEKGYVDSIYISRVE